MSSKSLVKIDSRLNPPIIRRLKNKKIMPIAIVNHAFGLQEFTKRPHAS